MSNKEDAYPSSRNVIAGPFARSVPFARHLLASLPKAATFRALMSRRSPSALALRVARSIRTTAIFPTLSIKSRTACWLRFVSALSSSLQLSCPISINARIADPDLERELKAYIADHSDTVVNAPFNPVIFELTDKGCNKGESVAWLGRYYGIEEDEIAVYGDGGNDIVMLERFRHSYAVANAADAAKAAASETIGYSALHAVPKHMMRTLRKQSGRVIIS